jgi:acyl-CoA thioesterase II
MTTPLQHLVDALTLECIDDNTWRGIGSENDGSESTYGGHFLGQASAAALASVADDRPLHSIHGYFLRGGIPGEPIDYEVDRVRDGRSFSARKVSAKQHGRVAFELMASFAVPDAGAIIEPAPPVDFHDLPSPQSLPRYSEVMAACDPLPIPAAWALREHGVDVRPLNAPWTSLGPSVDNGIRHWIRANGEAPVNPALHSAMLAYQSDESVSDCLLIPFQLTWSSPGLTFVSLDHAMWFHRQIDLNAWHFVEQWASTASQSRGLTHGRVWDQNGALVASYSQEVLMRMTASED